MNIDLIPYSLEIGVGVLLLAMVLLDSFLPLEEKGGVWGLGSLGLLALLGGSFLLTPQTLAPGSPEYLSATWVLDPFALYFKQFFLLTALFSLLGARAYAPRFRHGEGELYSLLLFATLGGMVLASVRDWISLFVGLELMTVTLFVLVSWNRRSKLGLEAGMKYVVTGTFSSAFLLYGITYLYGFTGTIRLGELREFLTVHKDAFDLYLTSAIPPAGIAPSLPETVVVGVLFGILLVTTGLLFKMAAFPFHVWAPDVYEGSPAPVTGFLGVASKGAGFVLAMRLGLEVYGFLPLPLTVFGVTLSLMAALAALTLAYGSLAAIPQWKTKRLMGYSSIAHAGYLMIGLAAGSHLGAAAVCYYLLAYCFTSWGLFLVLCALDRYTPEHEIRDLRGLGKRNPLLGITLAMSLLSLAGIPPFSGFFGKLLLLMAAFEAELYWLGGLGMLMAVVGMYVYLGVLRNVYSREPLEETRFEIDGWTELGCYVACAGMIVVGVFQGPFLQAAEAAARCLLL